MTESVVSLISPRTPPVGDCAKDKAVRAKTVNKTERWRQTLPAPHRMLVGKSGSRDGFGNRARIFNLRRLSWRTSGKGSVGLLTENRGDRASSRRSRHVK